MGNVLHAENSNSVNDNSVYISGVEQHTPELLSLHIHTKKTILTRPCYLEAHFLKKLHRSAFFELTNDDLTTLTIAKRRFQAETHALHYLQRAEHCHRQLASKLAKKGFTVTEYTPVLKRLRNLGYLDDMRYARAWIQTRMLSHYEGKKRIFSELLTRGVSQTQAKHAVHDFFITQNEQILCNKALKKQLQTKKNREQIIRALIRKGFSYSLIKTAFEHLENA